MRFVRVHLEHFGAVASADVSFGPGLNILFGPNDLGKSTIVEAIRLALLLPASSTAHGRWAPWVGAHRPIVELDFATAPDEIWRVRKEYADGAGGKALLQRSRDGINFDDVVKSRGVDGELRKILRWGIPEPGGAGASKGLPFSFLGRALISTQESVADVLGKNFGDDITTSGRDRVAEALQAAVQDPLFARIFKRASEMHDRAYSASGKRSVAQNSPFAQARDALRARREERDAARKIVEESAGAGSRLLELQRQLADAEEATKKAGALLEAARSSQASQRAHAAAKAHVDETKLTVEKLQRSKETLTALARTISSLEKQIDEEKALLSAREAELATAHEHHRAAAEAARLAVGDGEAAETVERQRLELAVRDTQSRLDEARGVIDAIETARVAAARVVSAEGALATAQKEAADAARAADAANTAEDRARQALARLAVLESGLDVIAAESESARAEKARVDRAELSARAARARATASELRIACAALKVPPRSELSALRKLEADVEVARRALEVGFALTLDPVAPLSVLLRSDDDTQTTQTVNVPLEFSARAKLEIILANVATIRVSGGSVDHRANADKLAVRWQEVGVPVLAAAGVNTVDGLAGKVEEAARLEADAAAREKEATELERRASDLGDTDAHAAVAAKALSDLRAAFGSQAGVEEELAELDGDKKTALRTRRTTLERTLKVAGDEVRKSAAALAIRAAAVEACVQALNGAITASNEHASRARLDAEAVAMATSALQASATAHEQAVAAHGQLGAAATERKERLAVAMEASSAQVRAAEGAVGAARTRLGESGNALAAAVARHEELGKQVPEGALEGALANLAAAASALAGAPPPSSPVDDAAATRLEAEHEKLKRAASAIEKEVERARGALEQTGGAVAQERLRDAEEALRLAEQNERGVEAEYEAWRLLRQTMEEAERAQASDLGRVFGPSVSKRFQELSASKYSGVSLSSQLQTEGVVVAGAVRKNADLSVGTREQLSTLFRLSLAERLRHAVVLDDQLVQSDPMRMDRLRAVLLDSAKSVQVIVVTCRPKDYVDAAALPTSGALMHDLDGVRSIDLARLIKSTP